MVAVLAASSANLAPEVRSDSLPVALAARYSRSRLIQCKPMRNNSRNSRRFNNNSNNSHSSNSFNNFNNFNNSHSNNNFNNLHSFNNPHSSNSLHRDGSAT